MAHAAADFSWASILPPRPLRWALRVFGIYLSAGVAVACVAGVAGVLPGSPLRALLTAPVSPPAMLDSPAPRADAPLMKTPIPEPADTSQEIATGPPGFPLSLAQASTGEQAALANALRVILPSPADDLPASAHPSRADWRVQLGAFSDRLDAVKVATSARRKIGAGEALVTEKLSEANGVSADRHEPGRKRASYLAQVAGLTVLQARAACGAGSTCLIFAPAEPVAPDLLPPDPPSPEAEPGR